jgi:hypothetical protein
MPGTPAFAVCVVDAEQSPADAGSYQAIAAVRRNKDGLTRTRLRLEIEMSRIILICSLAALVTSGVSRSSNAIESAKQTLWAQARLACADVGIDPGSSGFGQCVFDLAQSLWDEDNEFER